jgi:hypothetical protein
MATTATKTEPIDYNHVYLYAKHHYKRGDLVKDLSVILGERAGIEPEYFERNPQDIVSCLLPLAFDAIKRSGNPVMRFEQFVMDIAPQNNFRVGGKLTHGIFGDKPLLGVEPESHEVRVIRSILSTLSFVTVIEKGVKILELGEADPGILPLNRPKKA